MGEMVHPAGNEAFANLYASAPAKTTVVLGPAGLRRLKKALLPARAELPRSKRQPGWGGNGIALLPL